MDRKRNPNAEEWANKIHKLKETWEDLFETIKRGNENADEEAKKSTELKDAPVYSLIKHSERDIECFIEGQWRDGSIRKTIHQINQYKYNQKPRNICVTSVSMKN